MALCSNFRSIVTIPLFCCYVNSQRYTVRETQCLGETKCYNLYDGDVTWDQAASYCQSINQRLAVIPDQDTQDVIRRFAGSGAGGGQLAWVGGRRSSSTMWRNVEGGTLQTQGMINMLSNQTRWCSGIRVTTLAADQGLFAILCYHSNSFRALCECPEVTECMRAPWYNVSSKCHEVSNSTFSSWESARAHCESLCQNGRLAFGVINQKHGAMFVPNYGTDMFWIGFHRRFWIWLAMQGEIVLSSFRNWLPDEGVAEETECMMVDLSRNGGWRDSECEMETEKFICEFDPRTTTTLPLPTSTRTPESITQLTTDMTLDQTIGMNTSSYSTDVTTLSNTTTDRPDASLLYYIIGGCAGVLLLIAVVVIAVCCNRRKNKEGKRSKHSVVEEGEGDTTEMTATTSTDLSSTKDGTAAQVKRPIGATESSAGLMSSVRQDKRKRGDNIGVNKDGQLNDSSLKPNHTETFADIYNDAEQVRARKAENKAKGVNNKLSDTSDARKHGSPPKAKAADPVYDDPAEVQVAKLRNPDEREAVESVSRDSATKITDNPLYGPS